MHAPTGSTLIRTMSAKALLLLALLLALLGMSLFKSRPVSSQASLPNLALNRPVTASSTESSVFPAGAAVDGDPGTRWASAAADPQWISVDLGSTQSIGRVVLVWETAYGSAYQIQTSNDASTWTTIKSVTGENGGTDDHTGLSGSGRYVRVYGTARGTQWGYSLWSFEVYGVAATPTSAACGTSNVAQGKAATASSAITGANLAVDGDPGTRWESTHGVDPGWIRVDLGSTQSICRVNITWEGAYASAYQIQVSNDGTTFTTIRSLTGQNGGGDDNTGLSGSGRYVRIYGTARGTAYGYSIWELQIFTAGGGSAPTATRTNTPISAPTATRTNTPVGAPTATRTPTLPPSGSCGTTSNIALNKPAYAWFHSTKETTPGMAVDGNMATRWDHLWYPSGPATAWLYVDLGSTAATITRVRISWESAFASGYQLQVSNDRNSWTTFYSTTTGDGAVDDITISPARTGRYMRINMTGKGTAWGYSFYELEIHGCNAGSAGYEPLPGPLGGTFVKVWEDNFDGTALNTSNWAYENDVHVNNEAQQYTAANVTVGGGTLKLTARKQLNNGYNYTSGRIYSKNLRYWTYGRFVAHMKLPVGAGYWPAFWMMGQNTDEVGWPGNGELDIMENIGYANWSSGALHGPGYWGAGSAGGQFTNLPAGYNAGGWNTYMVEWDPTYIRWYVNGNQVLAFTRDQIIANYGQWTYNNPKYIILNLALGGDYPAGYNGCGGSPLPAGCVSPGLPSATDANIVAGGGVVEVDYVQVWQKQ